METIMHHQLKKAIRERIIEVWNNTDNPPEDKLINIFEYAAEKLMEYADNQRN